LEALKSAKTLPYLMSQEEGVVYDRGLKLYLENSSRSPTEVAHELETTLQPCLKAHPEYAEVRFLLAAAFANLKKFEEFFYQFYKAYTKSPTCFMAYRTIAIINIKLFEKARTLQEKEARRQEAQKFLKLALDEDDKDPMLYKLLVLFAPKNEKKQLVKEIIERIIRTDVVIPRHEIALYVNAAVDINERGLAKQFLNKAATWYEYSRNIQEMREHLDDKSDAG